MVRTDSEGPAGSAAERDRVWMAHAVDAADAARRRTAPNPWVGCVLVDAADAIVGTGATAPPGGDHAEVRAIAAAGARAAGATAYVTLEPCTHHGRTGPCVDALAAARVRRVVVALEDPDPRVAGRGLARLRAAGVDVTVGVGATEAARALAPYLHHRRTGRAWAQLKTATSIDGRTAAADGTSQWITGDEARADAHELRADAQAIVIGAGTALTDRPTLTARPAERPPGHSDARPDEPPPGRPTRVLLDGRGRVPATGPLFDPDLAPTLVLTTARAPERSVAAWRAAGAKVEVIAPGPSGGVDLTSALAHLGGEGVLHALIEGGATVHGAFVVARLADALVQYLGGAILGPDGLAAIGGPGPVTLTDTTRWRLAAVRPVGVDVRLDWEPV
ncbi:MAG TPA: bifunctional diaminohydroxyphosphoribosylaminopyrimidine deaminase/5-amino-6-(5-phosphoribosylamino)uracil reductase RibD [Acidimicrobiia bacterium]|nr:bifunctional diaminohydroxyphosphoribosylaminopyrimidine deaminase/5-amino-6-(5-phosphoribosylamino)uracil reductase RibD [Acidimicrobiia bacterium]